MHMHVHFPTQDIIPTSHLHRHFNILHQATRLVKRTSFTIYGGSGAFLYANERGHARAKQFRLYDIPRLLSTAVIE